MWLAGAKAHRWCGSGYIAAGLIAEDMGIRDQDWWVSKPGEWFMQNAERLVQTGSGWQYLAEQADVELLQQN